MEYFYIILSTGRNIDVVDNFPTIEELFEHLYPWGNYDADFSDMGNDPFDDELWNFYFTVKNKESLRSGENILIYSTQFGVNNLYEPDYDVIVYNMRLLHDKYSCPHPDDVIVPNFEGNKKFIYSQALQKYGIEPQLDMVIEECSELINAICKFRRNRNTEEDIITEIADVMIMCEQMSVNFGEDKVMAEKEIKLARLAERLNN